MCLWSQYCTSRFTVSLIISTRLMIKLKILSLFIYMIKNRSPEIVWCLTFASWQVMEVWLVQMGGKKKTCQNLSIRVPNIYGLHPEPHLQISFAFLKRWTHTCARYLQRTFVVSETSVACYLHSQWSFKWKTTTAARHSLFWLINSILHEEKGALCKSDYSPNWFFFKVHWLSEYRSKIYFANLF